jgi:hypothetical protein
MRCFRLVSVFGMTIILLLTFEQANADARDLRKIKSHARVLKQKMAEIKRHASRLSGAEIERAHAILSRMRLPDQDDDGVPDIMEEVGGTDACNPVSDGENPDFARRERKGYISDIATDEIMVGGLWFIITPQTDFEDIEEGELEIDECVEAEGFENDEGEVMASRISARYDCDDSDSGLFDHRKIDSPKRR